jgi:hypothetical protein
MLLLLFPQLQQGPPVKPVTRLLRCNQLPVLIGWVIRFDWKQELLHLLHFK